MDREGFLVITIISYHGAEYTNAKKVEKPSEVTSIYELPLGELIHLYERIHNRLGLSVEPIPDLETGIRYVWEALKLWGIKSKQVTRPITSAREPIIPKRRKNSKWVSMRFNFPYLGDDRLRKIRDPKSLRGLAHQALNKGATFQEIIQIVKKFDRDRGKSPGWEERRAYEVIRLLHHYIGFGVKQTEDGRIYTFPTIEEM